MGQKILITGGAGFIGSHTAVMLHEAGYTPVIVDNFNNSSPLMIEGIRKICGKEFPFFEGDCVDRSFLREVFAQHSDLAGVIHFAAYKAVGESNEFPLKYYHNNLGSLVSLLDVMLEKNVKNLVFSSSCTVYGSPDQIPVSEEAPIKETPSTYGKTKQLCEDIISDVISKGQMIQSVLLRYFNPIGAHPSGLIGELPMGVPNNLVPFITQTAIGLREKLTVYGRDYQTPDGTCIRDYIHVLDLARAHIKAFEFMENNPQSRLEKFNVGTGKGQSVLDVINIFESVSGQKLNYVFGPRRNGDVESVYADPSKANRLLNWKAQLTIADAIKDAWHWQTGLSEIKK